MEEVKKNQLENNAKNEEAQPVAKPNTRSQKRARRGRGKNSKQKVTTNKKTENYYTRQ